MNDTRARRALDGAEAGLVRMALNHPDDDVGRLVSAARYGVALARLGEVDRADGSVVDFGPRLHAHRAWVLEHLEPRLADPDPLWAVLPWLPDLVARTRTWRDELLRDVDRDALEHELTHRRLALVLGGGGGAGYGYSGVFDALHRAGLVPDLVVGTSIGALLGMFRAQHRRFDMASLMATAKRLSWSKVFRVLETESRYGLPAALRLYLRAALRGRLEAPDGSALRMKDMEIPLYIIVAGLTVDAMRHNLDWYEHLLDPNGFGSAGMTVRTALKAMTVVREFLSRPEALVQIVCGRDEGTEEFDVLDAAGFSAAVPGVIHYDVLRDDPRMRMLLDRLYARYGITRLGEGGLVANVGAKVAWESFVGGKLGPGRTPVTLAVDCFWPNPRTPVWFPLQQAVRSGNVAANRPFADVYLPLSKTLSPMNLVPGIRDTLTAMQWGKDAIDPHLPFLAAMLRGPEILHDR